MLDNQSQHQAFGKKLYHEQLSTPEQETICDTVVESLAERLEHYIFSSLKELANNTTGIERPV